VPTGSCSCTAGSVSGPDSRRHLRSPGEGAILASLPVGRLAGSKPVTSAKSGWRSGTAEGTHLRVDGLGGVRPLWSPLQLQCCNSSMWVKLWRSVGYRKFGELCSRHVTSSHGHQTNVSRVLVRVACVGDPLEAAGFQLLGSGPGNDQPLVTES